jgi:hypothetical protein
VGRSYIYPAMARSFREAGIQVATHFAYDPTFMADVNTEYGTHYMNLAYTPQKALSLKIASEVFHQVPMNKSYGGYPANTTFESFRVRYEDDLAEMVTEKAFYHTNHTKTSPTSPEKLEHIAGSGDSPLVRYEGTGAYFLDRLEPGVWRLEVMPDAIWIEDPFTPTSPKKQVGAIRWNAWPMTVTLPDLGPDFQVTKMNGGSASASGSSNGNFVVMPGTYVLTKKGITSRWKATDNYERIRVGEFTAPEANVRKTYVLHQPLREVADGAEVDIEATIVGKDIPATVEVHVLTQGRRSEIITMKRERNYTYRATIGPGVGFLRYYIVVKDGKGTRTFPADAEGGSRDWDFYDRRTYEVPVVPPSVPLYLFDASTDASEVSRPWIWNSGVFPTEVPGKLELRIPVEKLFIPDPENRNGEKIADYSMRYFFGKKIAGRIGELAGKTKIILNGRSLVNRPTTLQVAVILRDGSTYGALVMLEAAQKDYAVSISDLKPVKFVTLPRPYPTFLPYYFASSQTTAFDITKVESLQISLGPGLSQEAQQQAQGFVIRTVRVE